MEHRIPGYPDYCIDEDTNIISYRTSNRKLLTKRWKRSSGGSKRLHEVVKLCLPNSKNQDSVPVHRIIIAAKLGRWPEAWEQARHLDGDWRNNSWDNICPGDYLLNCIDEVMIGRRKTNERYLRESINKINTLMKNFHE